MRETARLALTWPGAVLAIGVLLAAGLVYRLLKGESDEGEKALEAVREAVEASDELHLCDGDVCYKCGRVEA